MSKCAILLVSICLFAQAPIPQPGGPNPIPLTVGNKWTYKAGKDIVTMQVEGTENLALKLKVTDDPKVTVSVARLAISSGDQNSTEYWAVMDNGVFRFRVAGKDIIPPLCILKTGKGDDAWQCDSISENIPIRGTFTAKDETVTVPAGTFKTRHVVGKDFETGKEKMNVEYWFANDVGVVKERVQVSGLDTVRELLKFEPAKR